MKVWVGGKFAYRHDHNVPGQPVQPVQVTKLGPRNREQARIRWLDGEYEGLEEWVWQQRLIVEWEKIEEFLEDERRLLAAIEASGNVENSVRLKAVKSVFSAPPVQTRFGMGTRMYERELLVIHALRDKANEFGLNAEELMAEPHAFINRRGDFVAPFQTAERLARQFCQRYPIEILRYIASYEYAYRQASEIETFVDPETDYEEVMSRSEALGKLAELKPVHDLIREWCGDRAMCAFRENEELRGQVSGLVNLIESTVRWLESNDKAEKAKYLARELKRIMTGPSLGHRDR